MPAAPATTLAGGCPSRGAGRMGTGVGLALGELSAAAAPARHTASRRRLGFLAGAVGMSAGPAGAAGAAGRRLLRRARGGPKRHRQQRRAVHIPAGAARLRLQGQAADAWKRQQPPRRFKVGTAGVDVNAAASAPAWILMLSRVREGCRLARGSGLTGSTATCMLHLNRPLRPHAQHVRAVEQVPGGPRARGGPARRPPGTPSCTCRRGCLPPSAARSRSAWMALCASCWRRGPDDVKD